MRKLKPCPFCGGRIMDSSSQPYEYADDATCSDIIYIVMCPWCGASVSSDNKQEAIDLWNTRRAAANDP